jgi:hypothetical protein
VDDDDVEGIDRSTKEITPATSQSELNVFCERVIALGGSPRWVKGCSRPCCPLKGTYGSAWFAKASRDPSR